MQIAEYLGQYANTLTNAAASPAAKSGNSSPVQNLVSAFSELKAGTVFEGSINAIDGSKVLLGLVNGQTIPARLEGSINLVLGQSVFFQVKSNDGNTVAIKPFTGGSAFNPTIQKALDAAGMEMTKETIDMVKNMMEEGMPIDRHALSSMRQTLVQHPQIAMSTAIVMSKLGIPVNEMMAAQFENYQNDRHMMLNQVNRVMEGLPDVFAKVSGDAADIVRLNQQVLSILEEGMPQGKGDALLFVAASENGEQMAGDGIKNEASLLQESAQVNESTAPDESVAFKESGIFKEGTILEQSATFKEDTILKEGMASKDGILPNEDGLQKEGLQQGQAAQKDSAAQEPLSQKIAPFSEKTVSGQGAENLAQELSAQASHAKTEASINGQQDAQLPHLSGTDAKDEQLFVPRLVSDILTKHQAAELEAQLKDLFPKAEHLKVNTQLQAKEFLDAIAQQLDKFQPNDREALSRLFSGKAYHALLKDVMEQQWTVRPEELKSEHKVEELYQRLDRQMAQIEQLARQTGMNTGHLSQSAAQVRDNIEFMNQINQAYTYVQIPLKLANQNAHSELYVYTNKRNLKKGEGELSAFLHLDLEHLGSTDVSIKMLDKKVSTKFYLADDGAYDLIAEHLPELEERLKKLGYNCNISIENREEKIDFVEDFLQKSQPQKAASRGMVHRYSFDVRA